MKKKMSTKKQCLFEEYYNNGIIQGKVSKNGFLSGEQNEDRSFRRMHSVPGCNVGAMHKVTGNDSLSCLGLVL